MVMSVDLKLSVNDRVRCALIIFAAAELSTAHGSGAREPFVDLVD